MKVNDVLCSKSDVSGSPRPVCNIHGVFGGSAGESVAIGTVGILDDTAEPSDITASVGGSSNQGDTF